LAARVTVTVETPVTAPPRWRHRVWIVAKLIVFVVLGLLVVQVAVSHRDELTGAGSYLSDIKPAWVVVAVAAEATSMLSFTALQRRLLQAGGLRVTMRSLIVITLAGNAMANSLPGGGAFASVFAFRQFRRKGADEALATWTLLAVTGLTAVTLAAVAAVGLVVAGNQGPVGGLGPLIALLLVGPLIGVGVLLRPRLLVTFFTPPLSLAQRVSGYPKRPAAALMSRAVSRLEAVTPRLPDWLVSLGLAAGNWLADCTCLVAAFLAVGAPVPARALLLAYGAAQVAANLPITPGGLGVVEGSLTVALVAFGGSTAATVAAVLLYRILSFWVLLPVGWAAWTGLKVVARRERDKEALT
jgi:putative heme transporter